MVAATPICNAIIRAILKASGYDQSAIVGETVQSAVTQSAITISYIWVETFSYALCAILLLFWSVENIVQRKRTVSLASMGYSVASNQADKSVLRLSIREGMGLI